MAAWRENRLSVLMPAYTVQENVSPAMFILNLSLTIVCINVSIQKASLKHTCDCGNEGQGGGLSPSANISWGGVKGLAPTSVDGFFQSGWRGPQSWSQRGWAKQSPEEVPSNTRLFCDSVTWWWRHSLRTDLAYELLFSWAVTGAVASCETHRFCMPRFSHQ